MSKLKLFYPFFLLAFYASCVSVENDTSSMIVGHIEKVDNIEKLSDVKILGGNLNEYYKEKGNDKDVNFSNLKLKQSGTFYYLLAENKSQKEIYAFLLHKQSSNLLLKKKTETHLCTPIKDQKCTFSRDEDMKINGCENGCNHSISVTS